MSSAGKDVGRQVPPGTLVGVKIGEQCGRIGGENNHRIECLKSVTLSAFELVFLHLKEARWRKTSSK